MLAYAWARPGELASPPPLAQCAAVRARAVPLVPWGSLTSGCTLWVAGGYLTLPWSLHSMAAQRQRGAAAWRRAGARAVVHGATAVCPVARRRLHSRSGRPWSVEPAASRWLAGPPGRTIELRGL